MKNPPNWGNDPLSEFIQKAHENTFATFVNLKSDYSRLEAIDALYKKAIDSLNNSPNWFPGFFLLRSHSSYLGAVRLSTSTQVCEAYMVLRGCLESALYGFFIANNSTAKKIWIDRHDDDETLKQMKKTFKIGPIFSLLKNTDEKLYVAIKAFYDRTIDYGGHPNPLCIFGALKIKKDNNETGFELNYLTNDSLQIQLALKTTAQVGVGTLMLFRYVFPERFEITGLTEEIRNLSKDL